VQRFAVDSAMRPSSYPGSMLDFPDMGSPDPLKRDLAYLCFLDELLGPEWVERWVVRRKSWRRCGSGERPTRPLGISGVNPRGSGHYQRC
jgi:hypothetical protein